MPRQRRLTMPSGYFHVLNRGIRKTQLFHSRGDYRAFSTVLHRGLQRHPIQLVSYCVMPNHWHLVVGPIDPYRLSRFMQWVTGTHATRWHRHRKTTGQGPVYQGRFHAVAIESAAELVRVCRYVERNALRARLVRRAQDWPWCSLADRLRPEPSIPIIPAVFLASNLWIDYVNAAVTERELLEQRLPERTSGTQQSKVVENAYDPLRDTAEDPGGLAQVFEDGEDIAGVTWVADQNEPHSHVEGAEHLGVVKSAGVLEPAEKGRDRPALAVK